MALIFSCFHSYVPDEIHQLQSEVKEFVELHFKPSEWFAFWCSFLSMYASIWFWWSTGWALEGSSESITQTTFRKDGLVRWWLTIGRWWGHVFSDVEGTSPWRIKSVPVRGRSPQLFRITIGMSSIDIIGVPVRIVALMTWNLWGQWNDGRTECFGCKRNAVGWYLNRDGNYSGFTVGREVL